MKKLLKKISLFFLSFLILISSYLTILAPSVHAQTWYSQNPFEWYIKVYDQNTSPPNEIFGERYTAAQVQWVVYSLFSIPVRMVEAVTGEDAISCLFKGLGTGMLDVKNCGVAVVTLVNKVTVGVFPDLLQNTRSGYNGKSTIALVFDSNRELSGIGYTKSLLKKFSLVSEVKAQGFGYTGLSWIQQYWRGFRDIAYTLLVLVVIIFAFMIMFRVKLNPQTVISVQSALPKIIVALILITFSYAIAGFAIDLMYVISGLIALLLNLAGFSNNLSGTYGVISGTGAGYSILGGLWILFMMLAYAIVFTIAAFVALISTIVSALNIFGAILGIIFMCIGVFCLLIMLWYTIKVPYVLLKTLVSLYITIITAPIQIMAGTIIPSMGFGTWFKKLMSDILVFPLVGLLVWFAWATLWSSYAQSGIDVARTWAPVFGVAFEARSWVPGIVGSTAFGVSGISGIIFLAISFGIILMIPKVPDMIKSFMAGKEFAGSAIGELKAVGLTAGSVAETYGRKRVAKATTPAEIARWKALERGGEIIQSVAKT